MKSLIVGFCNQSMENLFSRNFSEKNYLATEIVNEMSMDYLLELFGD